MENDPWAPGAGEVGRVLRRCGGVATLAQLTPFVSRTDVARALAEGSVLRVARGRYVLPSTSSALSAAHAAGGVVSHSTAALLHGWPVLSVDDRIHVTVPRGSRARTVPGSQVVVHHARLEPDEVQGSSTSASRTLADSLRTLPLREALAVADSAARDGWSNDDLLRVARGLRGHGAGRARRIAAAATPLADNPFESALRALAWEVGLVLEPQVEIADASSVIGRVDLAERARRIVAEADSFAWHGQRSGLVRDARRYNRLAVAGWLVLRFTWEDVVSAPEQVRATLREAAERRTQVT